MAKQTLRGQRTVATLAFVMAALLVVESVTGTLTNLFVEIPKQLSEWTIMRESAILLSHVILGFLLAAGALSVVALSIITRRIGPIVISLLGLAGILLAMTNGFYFLTSQNNFASFSMAIGFAFSMLVYVTLVFVLRYPPATDRS